MPLKFLAVSFFNKIFPFQNAGNSRFVILPRQFNCITDEFALTFEFSIGSVREISSGQFKNHYTPLSTLTTDNGLKAPFLSGYIVPFTC